MRSVLGVLAVSMLAVACDSSALDNEWSDWTVGVYYTAVESYYDGPGEIVLGCTDFACTKPNVEIGMLPRDFVAAVRDEGTGRITSGPHAGEYLNWSYDIGFRLDDQPRDANGQVLQPFRSAAATGLDPGTRLRLTDCGLVDPADQAVCARLEAAEWTVGDEFTPGLGGPRHLDLYIGEESDDEMFGDREFLILLGAMLEPILPP